jgi:hypothetical protein
MNPEDPEQYIRDLERGGAQTPGAAPQPSSTDSASQFGMGFSAPPPLPSGSPFATSSSGQFGDPGGGPLPGGTSRRRFRGVTELVNTRPRWLILVCAVTATFAIALFLALYSGKTTVHGNLVMINGGAKQTIECNDGNVKLDGDDNTYTITGHCRRLEVFGSANRVTVDSADTISVFGDDNVMLYQSGSPTINKTGNNNTVSQRPSTR